ncbi:MAG: hypothetical protein ACYDCO_12590 [Armatimonadota bacterium]
MDAEDRTGCFFHLLDLLPGSETSTYEENEIRIGLGFAAVGGTASLGFLGWYLVARPHPLGNLPCFLLWFFPVVAVIGLLIALMAWWRGRQ